MQSVGKCCPLGDENTFFLKNLDSAATRLTSFVNKSATASLAGAIFDDAATGHGLLNFFLRAVNSGAVTIDEAARCGLTMDQLKSRSFEAIIKARANAESFNEV